MNYWSIERHFGSSSPGKSVMNGLAEEGVAEVGEAGDDDIPAVQCVHADTGNNDEPSLFQPKTETGVESSTMTIDPMENNDNCITSTGDVSPHSKDVTEPHEPATTTGTCTDTATSTAETEAPASESTRQVQPRSKKRPRSKGSSTRATASPSPKSTPLRSQHGPQEPPACRQRPEKLLYHLEFPYPASLLQDRSFKRARNEAIRHLATLTLRSQPPQHICGLDLPMKKMGVCGTCGTGDEDPSNTIVLCDGQGCGQEFHMQCCMPPLVTVPKGAFYCFDCCEKGTTKQLEEYFTQHEQRKDEHERLVLRNNKKKKALPSTFADALLEEDVIKRGVEAEASHSTDSIKQKSKGRGNTSRMKGQDRDDDLLVPCSELEMFYDRHQELIGKPVRMYCPLGNNYHNGRILDTRRNEESEQVTCLVRFPAGKDHRKTALTIWMDLEEHSLAVATNIVWATFGPTGNENNTATKKKGSNNGSKHGKSSPSWTQAKLWRRNARELVPVLDSLIEEQHQIRFRKICSKVESPKKTTEKITKSPTAGVRWGLLESFGPPGFYQLLDLERATKPDMPAPMVAQMQSHSGTPKGEQAKTAIVKGLVEVELKEQERVREWNAIPLHNSFHDLALKSQDEMALGSLVFQTPKEKEYLRTTSLVDQGLDRSMILALVAHNLDLPRSKDMSIDMVCEIVESLPSTVQSITVRDASTSFLT